jgi:hypothetical protein
MLGDGYGGHGQLLARHSLGDCTVHGLVNSLQIRSGTLTLTGIPVTTIAANGPVAVALNGFGNFGGLESTTQLGNFSVTMASGTTNTLDFIF